MSTRTGYMQRETAGKRVRSARWRVVFSRSSCTVLVLMVIVMGWVPISNAVRLGNSQSGESLLARLQELEMHIGGNDTEKLNEIEKEIREYTEKIENVEETMEKLSRSNAPVAAASETRAPSAQAPTTRPPTAATTSAKAQTTTETKAPVFQTFAPTVTPTTKAPTASRAPTTANPTMEESRAPTTGTPTNGRDSSGSTISPSLVEEATTQAPGTRKDHSFQTASPTMSKYGSRLSGSMESLRIALANVFGEIEDMERVQNDLADRVERLEEKSDDYPSASPLELASDTSLGAALARSQGIESKLVDLLGNEKDK